MPQPATTNMPMSKAKAKKVRIAISFIEIIRTAMSGSGVSNLPQYITMVVMTDFLRFLLFLHVKEAHALLIVNY